MKKQVKRYGDSTIIKFSKEEQEIYKFGVGDVLDLEISVIKNKKLKGGVKNKMKKVLMSLPLLALFALSVMAVSTKLYSVRNSFDASSVDNYYGQTVTWANGEYNAWLSNNVNSRDGVLTTSGAGYIRAILATTISNRETISISWDWKGNNYGFAVLEDSANKVSILANARVIHNGVATYSVPVVITYMKTSGEFIVEDPSGNFRFSI